MDKRISGEFRHEFEQMFGALATANPHISIAGRRQCEKALDLVEGVVRGTVARGVPTYIEADDLIQECLVRLPDAISAYTGKHGASVKTYLKAVIRHDVLDVIGHERRQPTNMAYRDNIAVGHDAPWEEEDIEWKDAALSYSHGLRQSREWERGSLTGVDKALLTPDQYDAVILCHVEGMTQEQAAKRLGITREALSSRLRKARAKIRVVLGKPVPIFRHSQPR